MARGKHQTRIIQVKSAPTSHYNVINLVELANKANDNTCKPDITPNVVKLSPEIVEVEIQRLNVTSTLEKSETARDYVFAMQQISPQPDYKKKNIEEDFKEVQLKTVGPADNASSVLESELMVVGQAVGQNQEESAKKQKKKKKSKKKRKKISPGLETTEQVVDVKRPVRLEPIKKTQPEQEDAPRTEVRALKNNGCFGFVSTWLAKRKEKRREKKRKAIEARKSKSVESLVVYENRKARGGVAFTVEVDSRPMKSVLPPIRQRPGPIRLATEQKLESAENKRSEHINKKREAARAHSRLVRDVADRRAQNERDFKQSTREKIREKESKALRATSRLKYAREQRCHSKCTSRMESAPDMLASKLENITSVPSSPRWEGDSPVSPLCDDNYPYSDCSIEHDIYYNVD